VPPKGRRVKKSEGSTGGAKHCQGVKEVTAERRGMALEKVWGTLDSDEHQGISDIKVAEQEK